MNRSHLTLTLIALLGGCSPSVRYYSLQPWCCAAPRPEAASGPAIEFRQVRFPEYLNNPQMVVRRSSGEMRVDEYHRWVEDLQPDFQRTLLANVSSLATSSAVFLSGASEIPPKYVVQLDVSRFEVTDDGSAQLWASYTISEPGAKVAKARVFVDQISESVAGSSTDARVEALSRLVRELAVRVTARLAPPES